MVTRQSAPLQELVQTDKSSAAKKTGWRWRERRQNGNNNTKFNGEGVEKNRSLEPGLLARGRPKH